MKQRINKNRRAVKRLKVDKPIPVNQSDEDKRIIDMVLKALYNNPHKNTLNLENDIYKPLNIALSPREANRLWNVISSTGFINPVIGFGNAGKIELTRAGYQLMSQFGSYNDYLSSISNQQPQTVILPIQIEADDTNDALNNDNADRTPGKKRAGRK